MAVNINQNGIGGTLGPTLVTRAPLYHLGAGAQFVWYVGPGGTDGASPAGWQREAPLATLGQAVTNANAGDIIVLLSGFTQNISSAITISDADIVVVSEGAGSSRARLTCTGAAIGMLTVTGAGTRFQNIYFPASTAAGSNRIRGSAAGLTIVDCTFDCGASDTVEAVSLITGWGNARLSGVTFNAVAATPVMAMEVVNDGARLTMDDVTFDGGSYSWSTNAFAGTGVITGLKANYISLLNNADMSINASSTGWIIPGPSSGFSQIYTS